MYRPKAFREDDVDKLVGFMQAHSFATLVTIAAGQPIASHVPLVVSVGAAGVTLSGHLAKANPQWQSFGAGESLAIFSGPHAYVAPALYESAESVPTWNYIAVHAYGQPRLLTRQQSPAEMEQMIAAMIEAYGPEYAAQWHSLSDTYREGMMGGIVGFELIVTRLEGKYKLSQSRSATDQQQVAAALQQSPDPAAAALGQAMQQNLAADP